MSQHARGTQALKLVREIAMFCKMFGVPSGFKVEEPLFATPAGLKEPSSCGHCLPTLADTVVVAVANIRLVVRGGELAAEDNALLESLSDRLSSAAHSAPLDKRFDPAPVVRENDATLQVLHMPFVPLRYLERFLTLVIGEKVLTEGEQEGLSVKACWEFAMKPILQDGSLSQAIDIEDRYIDAIVQVDVFDNLCQQPEAKTRAFDLWHAFFVASRVGRVIGIVAAPAGQHAEVHEDAEERCETQTRAVPDRQRGR